MSDFLDFGPEPMGARASSPAPTGAPAGGSGFNWQNAAGYGLMGLLGGFSGQNVAPMLLMSQMMNKQNAQQDPQALAKLIVSIMQQQRQRQQAAQAPVNAVTGGQVVGDAPPNMNLLGGAQ